MIAPRMRPMLLLLGLLYLYPSMLQAQPRPVFEQLVPNAALSASEITGLLQDDAGFLWIATIQGLNRFDGRNTKHFFHSPSDLNSLSDNILIRNTLLKHGV